MTGIGIIRCEKNMDKCPLTSCLKSLFQKKEGFSIYGECALTGIFTCRCPGDIAVEHARILKGKGAGAIHFCTCTFSSKGDNGWTEETGGFCDHINDIMEKVRKEVNISCVKGTAHLPKDYTLRMWG
jgi:predicted metal-binding protein